MLQNLAALLLRQIDIQYHQVRAWRRLICLRGVDKVDRLLSIRYDMDLGRDPGHLESRAHQIYIRGVVFHDQDMPAVGSFFIRLES